MYAAIEQHIFTDLIYFPLIPATYPYILGSDGAGIVEKVGPGVTNVKKGDPVVFQGDVSNNDSATFQEYAVTEAILLSKIPPNVSAEQAATIPVGIIAPVVGLYDQSGLGLVGPWTSEGVGKYKGESIFVTGGASTVGKFGKWHTFAVSVKH